MTKINPNILYEVKIDDFHAIGRYLGKTKNYGADRIAYEFEIVEKFLPWNLDIVYMDTPEVLNKSGSICKQAGTKEDYPEYFL